MAFRSGLTRADTGNAVSPRHAARLSRNRRADYLARIEQAPDNRMKIARAAEAVRAAGKDADDVTTDCLVNALLALAGLASDEKLHTVAGQLLELAGPA